MSKLRYPGPTDDENFENAPGYVEMLFPFFPDNGDFELFNIIHNAKITGVQLQKMLSCQSEMRIFLHHHKYVEPGFPPKITLSLKGRLAKALGGHEKYLLYSNTLTMDEGIEEQETRASLKNPSPSRIITGNQEDVSNQSSNINKKEDS